MSQWIKRWDLAPVQLALVLIVFYYLVAFPGPVTLTLALLVLGRLYWKGGKKASRFLLVAVLPFLVLFAGQTYQKGQKQQALPEHLKQLQVIPDTIRINGDSLSFRGKQDGQLYQAFYKLKSKEEQTFFQGLTQAVDLTIEGELTEAEGRRNFQGFDYKAYLETQGIYAIVSIAEITDIRQARSLNPLTWLSQWRRSALVYIRRTFPSPMKHYMTGLLFGDLDKEFEEMGDIYSSLGIIHLFALSGMQVGFFVDRFRRLLLMCGLGQEAVDVLQVPFSVVYAGLTGFSASVIRSLLQKVLANQGISGFDNLGLTVLLSFLVMPNFLLTAGGVLSFSYAFILTLMDFDHLVGWKRTLTESLALSLGILPLLIWCFASFQPLSILLTFAFSILFDSLFLPLLSLLFLLSPFWTIAELNSLFQVLERIISWLGALNLRPLVLGKPSLLILLALLLGLGLVYDHYQKTKVLAGLSLLLALLFFLTKHPLENEVTVVDIGQGDSLFLRDIRGKTVLIDVGGRVSFEPEEDWRSKQVSSNAERTLIPYLHSRGVGKIDQLVLTHTDTDHVGDLEEVAKALSIGEILVSQGSLTNADFVDRLKALKVKVRVLTAGDSLPIMGSQLQVLYPWETGDGGNNDSLVLYGRLLGANFLFTGDLEEGELDLIERYSSLPVDVLKAGHHGSKGSSYPEFLDHINAKIALVSAGKNNRYKHPHKETLERFANQNMTVYRTDQDGAIRFKGLRKWSVEVVR
ncbi:competence protein ComEC [Streptococcus rupicaprae]|uniref:Competence protein ComEC n=1 Tax=Streptococcus rupicaprae TaxID=759619 RepID=A0ABV2FKV0_9STRE